MKSLSTAIPSAWCWPSASLGDPRSLFCNARHARFQQSVNLGPDRVRHLRRRVGVAIELQFFVGLRDVVSVLDHEVGPNAPRVRYPARLGIEHARSLRPNAD